MKLRTKWFFVQWGEGDRLPDKSIDEEVNEFIDNQKINPDDLIKIEYKSTEIINSNGKPYSNYTVFITYRSH